MATINFLFRSTKEKSNLVLRLLFRHNGKDFVFGTKTQYEVSKMYWVKYHKQKRPKDIEIINQQIEVKKELNKIENHVLKAFKVINPEEVNKSWLEEQIKLYYNPPIEEAPLPTELLRYFDYFLDYKKSEITKSSIKKYSVVRNLLEKYEFTLDKTLSLQDVNSVFKKDFEDYCLNNKYSPNTIAWAIRSIKTVCNHAKLNGLKTNIQLDAIKAKSVKVPKIYLSFEELDIIENIDVKKLSESLINARDWLIISCYTGQRVSDFMRFTKSHVRIERGKKLLEFTQQKTGKIMTIPLHRKVIDILNKKNGEFPRPISSQKYNTYIKKVCEIAELNELLKASKRIASEVQSKFPFRNEFGEYKKWELVSSHIGRRSFATNFYGEIPTSFLIYVTGHSTEQMFLNYIGKSNKDLAMELTKYF